MEKNVWDLSALVITLIVFVLYFIRNGLGEILIAIPLGVIIFLLVWKMRFTFNPETNEVTFRKLIGSQKTVSVYEIADVRVRSRRKGGSLEFTLRSGEKFWAWRRCKNMDEFLKFLADRGILEG